MDQRRYEEEVAERARTVMRAIVDSGNITVWNAHAFFALDAVDDDALVDAVERHFGVSDFASDSVAGGPFHVLPAALLLRRWEERLPSRAVERIRDFFMRGVIDRGNTENHWLMHYTGNLLAAERWAEAPVMWNGLSPAAVRAEARRWIVGMIDRSVMIGHHEYDSTGYIAEHVTPLIGLAELASDEALREKARKMLALHFTDMAVEYFHGAWAGGHSREGYRVNTWMRSGTVRGIHYVYFGNEEFDPPVHTQGFVVPGLATSYRPPALIISMAFDRGKPFVVRKTKAPRTIYRHAERPAAPVRKYTYQSRSFALGSTQIGLPGPPAAPIDLTSWDLTWNGPKHQAKIVCNHPYRDPRRFSAFLPMLPQTAERDIGTGKPYLQRSDRLFGASPYERIMQHENVVIVLYRIDPADRDPYVNLYLPKALRWVERNGWLFAEVPSRLSPNAETETGAFYVALFPIGRYRWTEIREAAASNIIVRDGDLIDGWLLRIDGPNAGLVLEAVEGPVDEADDRMRSFDEFIARRSGLRPGTDSWPDRGVVSYTTFGGISMKMCYDGEHLVDGIAVDYDKWPLIEAPWVRAKVGTGVVRYEKDGRGFDLDFEVVGPLIPMRVIG